MSEAEQSVAVYVVAVISICSSLSILCTAALFPIMRRKMFFQIICYISLADTVGNTLYINPNRPVDGSIMCSIEGFLHLYCYPVSWLWSTMLMYFLYSLAFEGKLPLSYNVIHMACWGIPLVLTLLNLTTNSYGHPSDYTKYEVCSISGNMYTGEIWHDTTYYGVWLLCVIAMIFMYCRIISVAKHDLAISVSEFQLALSTMGKYPVALVVFWFPHMFFVVLSGIVPLDSRGIAYLIGVLMYILHGAGTTVIFFHHSPLTQKLWIDALRKLAKYCCQYIAKSGEDFIFRETGEDFVCRDIDVDSEMYALKYVDPRPEEQLSDLQPGNIVLQNPIRISLTDQLGANL